ncbi:MAG: hydrogenase maturation protease [Cytophagales bacterium]|nr:hydrogenase maturation protease [Cytophagales bacterium]
MKRILIYGYGNPGRQDDALGILLAEKLETWATENGRDSIDFDSNYQLNIEDALTISEYDTVIFADASIEDIPDFIVTEVRPSQKTEFTMHAMTPAFILHLCQSLYGKFPKTFLIHLKGYEFNFLERLTSRANQNLHAAFDFLIGRISVSGKTASLLEKCIIDQKENTKISLS